MLTVPRLLEDLLAAGRWPRDAAEGNSQNLNPWVAPERVPALAPDEQTICLQSPPFRTIRELSEHNSFWTWDTTDPDGIDFDLAMVIGDFGPGSDAPILLDYRDDVSNPRVIRLRWSPDGKANKWVVMAPDFASFVAALGLHE